MTLTADEFTQILQFFKDSLPLTNEGAIINQLTRMELKMAAFEVIETKLNLVAAAIAAEATEVKAEIDKLKALAATDRITPEQLETISTRFDGVITAVNGIITPEVTAPPAA